MSTAKTPHLRYRIIHACLSNRQRRYWSKEELKEKLEEHDLVVNNRTIERDLNDMRFNEQLAYLAPIEYDRAEKGYYYTDKNFTIDKFPLTQEELQSLTLCANILQQYKGVPFVQQYEGAVDKLVKIIDHLKRPTDSNIIVMEESPYYKGHCQVDGMITAIVQHTPLRITYRKFNVDEDHIHIFHPYFLKEYRGRWYTIGHSEARQFVITLGLDRMEKIEETTIPFRENKKIKPKEYFKHTIGVTLGSGPVEDIELQFSPTLAPYIKTQHLHHTQKTIAENKDGLIVVLKLIPNPELTQLILGYGADVKVLRPASLREAIRTIWQKALE